MTKEELEKEAEEYIKTNNLEWELECHRTSPIGEVEQAYIAGAEPREKRIAELEAQIEKMKTRIKEIIFSNDFVNTSPYQNLKNKVSALCDFYKEIKEK